ncbi:MAG: hypothetical protein BWY59_00070 [Verrucomicrobia bacterium ADurb.Bin345]|nr:MAG: hypothetical protein BWY59_00070 [Verrucomicrobia bacterium ADurb.Bin345]
MRTPTGASCRPMTMMTGPVTMGGRNRLIVPMPPARTPALMRAYTSPVQARAPSVAPTPKCSMPYWIGTMNAKELARNMGTMPPVMAWKRSVPAPAVNKAMQGLSPVRIGTSTNAPKATKSICTPSTTVLTGSTFAMAELLLGATSMGKNPLRSERKRGWQRGRDRPFEREPFFRTRSLFPSASCPLSPLPPPLLQRALIL